MEGPLPVGAAESEGLYDDERTDHDHHHQLRDPPQVSCHNRGHVPLREEAHRLVAQVLVHRHGVGIEGLIGIGSEREGGELRLGDHRACPTPVSFVTASYRTWGIRLRLRVIGQQALNRRDDWLPRSLDLLTGRVRLVHMQAHDRTGSTSLDPPGHIDFLLLGAGRQHVRQAVRTAGKQDLAANDLCACQEALQGRTGLPSRFQPDPEEIIGSQLGACQDLPRPRSTHRGAEFEHRGRPLARSSRSADENMTPPLGVRGTILPGPQPLRSLREDVQGLREDVQTMTGPPASTRPPFPQEHEEIVSVWHRSSGLAAVIAIHSTVRGPALGGCRFRVYPTLDAAVAEAGRLSEAMTFKSALAGLPFGGGKAVLIGNPASAKTRELLFDYAEVLNQLGGRYVTAEDVGTTQADMDTLSERTKFVAGTSVDRGGSGDPSPMTAYGVLCAMQATANHLWGSDDLTGRRVAISGVGKVGSELARLLLERDCQITIADVSTEAVEAMRTIGPADVTDPEQIHRVRCDIFAPCALGGALNERSISELDCNTIVGAANNQLSSPEVADALHSESITYIPDFLANAGGVINIAHEHLGYEIEKARAHVQEIYTTTRTILGRSEEQQITPLRAAMALAEERIAHP